jgi:K+-transporting ATPase KdpF subunit
MGWGAENAGRRFYPGDDWILRGGDGVRARLRSPEVRGTEMIGNIILLGVCVLVLGYLFAALLWPERF